MSSRDFGHLATHKVSHLPEVYCAVGAPIRLGICIWLEVSLGSRDVGIQIAGEVDCSRAQMSGRTALVSSVANRQFLVSRPLLRDSLSNNCVRRAATVHCVGIAAGHGVRRP